MEMNLSSSEIIYHFSQDNFEEKRDLEYTYRLFKFSFTNKIGNQLSLGILCS